MSTGIQIDVEKIAEFCRKNRIRRLSLFGSVLRDDFKPESDVDVLVELKPDSRVGLIRFSGMESELSGIIGRKVDLRTPEDLSPCFREEVMETAEVQYAEG